MGGVAPALAAEVNGRVARVVVGRGWRVGPRRLKALVARPGLEERPIDREVLVGEQALLLGLRADRLEEGLGDVPGEEPIPVLGEHGRVPDRLVQVEADEPTEQEIVVELLHELPLAPDAVERLEQQGAEELLRRDRGPAGVGVQQGEARRQLLQGAVRHGPNRAERMILRDALFGREVAPHVALRASGPRIRRLLVSGRSAAHYTRNWNRVTDEITSFSAHC